MDKQTLDKQTVVVVVNMTQTSSFVWSFARRYNILAKEFGIK